MVVHRDAIILLSFSHCNNIAFPGMVALRVGPHHCPRMIALRVNSGGVAFRVSCIVCPFPRMVVLRVGL
eukprot:12014632-Karenia_brevis.AAC.1